MRWVGWTSRPIYGDQMEFLWPTWAKRTRKGWGCLISTYNDNDFAVSSCCNRYSFFRYWFEKFDPCSTESLRQTKKRWSGNWSHFELSCRQHWRMWVFCIEGWEYLLIYSNWKLFRWLQSFLKMQVGIVRATIGYATSRFIMNYFYVAEKNEETF